MTAREPPAPTDEQEVLLAALRKVLEPLATLAVQRGLPYAAVEELLRRAFVGAADAAHPDVLAHRKVSRLATTTGINRREVARLLGVLRDAQGSQQLPRRSLASEVFAHWMSNARYRDRRGEPRVLKRQGRAPSFESLAQAGYAANDLTDASLNPVTRFKSQLGGELRATLSVSKTFSQLYALEAALRDLKSRLAARRRAPRPEPE